MSWIVDGLVARKKGNKTVRTEAWALQKPNGTFISSKKIDPTNPIKIALFNTKRHAKVFLEENTHLTDVAPKKVTIKVVSAI